MLRWQKGNHKSDGIWWKHWYDNVINTTKFEKKIETDYKTKFSKKTKLYMIVQWSFIKNY